MTAWSTLNPSDTTGGTLSNGNLTYTAAVNNPPGLSRASDGYSTGKFYFEITINFIGGLGSPGFGGGLCTQAATSNQILAGTGLGAVLLEEITADEYALKINGTQLYFAAVIPLGVFGVAVDLGSKLVWARGAATAPWNNNGTANPATATGGEDISGIGAALFPFVVPKVDGTQILSVNLGQSVFAGSVPAGFTAGWPGVAVPTGLTVDDATTTTLTASWTGAGGVQPDTLNPADLTHLTLSGGNLTATQDGTGSAGGVRSIHSQTSGKYYFEWQLDSLSIGSGGSDTGCGIALASYTLGTNPPGGATGLAAAFPANPFLGSGHWHVSLWVNTTNVVSDVAGFDTTVQPFGVAIDLTANEYWAYCPSDGLWNGSASANPATGAGGISISAIATGPLFAMVVLNGATADAITVNFGATSFSNAVPSGFFAGWPGGAPPTVTYTLQYRLTGTTTWTQVAGITGTSLTVTGLTPGTEYDFQVEAVSADGPSGFTATVQAFTLGLAGTVVFTPAQLPGWRAQCGINWNGMALVGDAFAGVVGLSDFAAFTEYGNPMIMQITSPPIQDSKMKVFIRLFEVYMQALGQTANANPPADDPKLWLDYSRDGGATFGAALLPRSIGRTGVNTARMRWQSLGSAREWVLRLTCADPVRRAIIGTYIRRVLGQS